MPQTISNTPQRTKATRNKKPGENFHKRQQEKTINGEGKVGRQPLGGEGWDPTTIDLLAILSIEIVWSFFNLQGFPKFPVMELQHSSNHTSLLNADMMIGFLHMLC